MKLLLYVFTLLGTSTALLPHHEYYYYYTAETKLGIPEVSPTYSIVGINSNVTIQVINREQVVVQMKDIKVVSDIATVKGGMHGYTEHRPNYQLVTQEARALEEPFTIYIRKNSGTVMTVPETDKEWVTNIRKSIATIIRVYPVVEVRDMKMVSTKIQQEFHNMEHTIFGHCNSHYTIKKISNQQLPMPGGRSAPSFGYDMCRHGAYNLTRSINFNQCLDRTLVQNTGISNRTTASYENHASVESRSSISYYTICGYKGKMQIQNMTTMGLFTLNPYGYETEKMQAVTNQTFRLSYVRHLNKPMVLKSEKEIKTYLMSVASPFNSGSSDERPWVNFYNETTELFPFLSEAVMTGESYDNQKSAFTRHVVNIIKRVAKIIINHAEPTKNVKNRRFDTAETEAPKQMQIATRLVRALDYKYLDDIWTDIFEERINEQTDTEMSLYIDCLAASGSSAAIAVLLDQIYSGAITDTRAKTIFMTLTNNIVNPEILPILVKYAMNLKMEEKPYLVSAVHVNLAAALRRTCTDNKIAQYSVPYSILGNRRCNQFPISRDYLRYLVKQLTHSKMPFERSIWVEAIANFGSIHALPVIKEVITGQHGRNASIRVVGIYALLHDRIPDAPKHHVSMILTSVFEDFNEDLHLRQTAILVQASWRPDVAFWQRLANLSWRDPSKELGSFIYSLISSTAKSTNPKLLNQALYAHHALNRARPYPPSFMYSYSYLWAKISPSYLVTEFSWHKINSNVSVVPMEIFTSLYNSYGGLDYTLFEECIRAFNADELIFRILKKIQTDNTASNPRSSKPMEYLDFLKIIKDELHFTGKDISPYQLFYILRLFNHMELFAPIDNDILNYVNNGENIIHKLLKGFDVNIVKYIDPSPIEMYIPLESGLPMAYRISYPIIFSLIGYVKLNVPNMQQATLMDILTASQAEIGINKNAKYMSTFIPNLGVLAPWYKKEVYTESYMTTNVNDPSQLNLALINSVNPEYVNTTLALYLKPNIHQEYPIAHSHNVPVVGVRTMWPDQIEENVKELHIATTGKPLEKKKLLFPKALFGISGYFKYEADTHCLPDVGTVYDWMNNPQKMIRSNSFTAKYWDYEYVIQPHQSETKSLNFSTTAWIPTTKFSSPIKNFTHCNEQNVDHTKDYPVGITARAHFNGSFDRYFEASIGTAIQYDEDFKKYGIRTTLHRSPLPGYSNTKGALCVNMMALAPKVYDFDELDTILMENRYLETLSEGKIYLGEQCHNSEFANFKTGLLVSEDEIKRIKHEIGNNGEYTPYHALAPYYDETSAVLNYKNITMQPLIRNITYMAYDALRGWAFPHVQFSYTNVMNTKNQLKFEAVRPMKSDNWEGTFRMPTETARFDSQHLPKHSYIIVSSNGLSELKYQCLIDNNKVRTFDRVWYAFPADQLKECWTVAAVNKNYPERLQILIRRPTSGYEVMISSSDHQINIEVSKTKIKVNGKITAVTDQAKWVKDSNGMQFAQVLSQFGKYEVSIPGNVTVYVSKNQISIMPVKSLKGKLNGICGDFNSEQGNEMIGSGNCYYQNVTRFSNSWTINHGNNCNTKFWNKAQNEVSIFQKTCAKAYLHSPKWELKKELQCETFIYPIVETPYVLCVCTDSVGMCLPGCTETYHVTFKRLYYCYMYDQIPSDVKPYIKRGYITHFPKMLPDVTQAYWTHSAYSCDSN